MKLLEGSQTDKTLDRLPDLPPDVEVPDDARALHRHVGRTQATDRVRWMRWLTAIVLLLGTAGLVTALIIRGDDADPTHTRGRGVSCHVTTEGSALQSETASPFTLRAAAAWRSSTDFQRRMAASTGLSGAAMLLESSIRGCCRRAAVSSFECSDAVRTTTGGASRS